MWEVTKSTRPCPKFLFSVAQSKSYGNTLIKDPNRSFGTIFGIGFKINFNWDECEIEANNNGMSSAWGVSDRWDAINDNMDNNITFGAFAGIIIDNNSIFRMLPAVIIKTKKFTRECKK
jgi:hypothetical protein